MPVNPSAPNEIQRQANTYGTYINRTSYTTPITVVPADQPLTPVKCVRTDGSLCTSQLRQMMAGTATDNVTYVGGGLPIPDDYVPSPLSDTDAEAVFYQPDYVSPNGAYTGRFYEAWKLRPNAAFDPTQPVSPANPKWTAAWGGRFVNVVKANGHYVDWTASGYDYKRPGGPDSTYQLHGWGVIAAGTLIASDEVSREDCARGEIDHAVGLMLHGAHPGQRWPAQRGDGTTSTLPVVEGMRLGVHA